MDPKIKRLLEFCAKDPEKVLLTSCSLKREEWYTSLLSIESIKEVRCTATDCEGEKKCIKMNPQGMFLPFHKYDVWIMNLDAFPYTPGYGFYMGYQTLKDFGILAIIHGNDKLDPVALTYGFQILYHGDWDYYLKAGKQAFER